MLVAYRFLYYYTENGEDIIYLWNIYKFEVIFYFEEIFNSSSLNFQKVVFSWFWEKFCSVYAKNVKNITNEILNLKITHQQYFLNNWLFYY